MTAYLYPLSVLALFLIFLWIRQLIRDSEPTSPGATALLAVTGALLVDVLVISSGRWLGEGELLEALSLGRWWLRVLVVPFLIITVVDLTGRLGVRAARTRVLANVAFGLTLLTSAVQGWASWEWLQKGTLVPVSEDWALFYQPAAEIVLPGELIVPVLASFFGLFVLLPGRWPVPLLGGAILLAEALFYPQPDAIALALWVLFLAFLTFSEDRAQREGLRVDRRDLSKRFERLG